MAIYHPLFAKIASVIGVNISKIYFEVNKDTKNYPASLTKIMTLYIIFDELKLKNINLNDRVTFLNMQLINNLPN